MKQYDITVWFAATNHTFYFTVRARSKQNALRQAKRKVHAQHYSARRS